jgi:hypothetical protein
MKQITAKEIHTKLSLEYDNTFKYDINIILKIINVMRDSNVTTTNKFEAIL